MKDDELAAAIMNASLKRIRFDYPELMDALSVCSVVSWEEYARTHETKISDPDSVISCDGKNLIYDRDRILARNVSRMTIERNIIHVLLHGLLGHFFDSAKYSRKKLAWTVMDIQVEQLLAIITGNRYSGPDLTDTAGEDNTELSTIDMSLYDAALKDPRLYNKVLEYGRRLRSRGDDHELWWDRRRKDDKRNSGDMTGEDHKRIWENAAMIIVGSNIRISSGTGLHSSMLLSLSSRRLLMNSRSRQWGSESSDEERMVTAKGKTVSFRDVLSKFITVHSVSKDRDDIFDTALYEYGLSLYGDIPLIEPADDIEEKHIDNIVIAMDTSGSCAEYIENFLAQVIEIFREIGNGISWEGIYLIQCDSRIKNVRFFDNPEMLETMKTTMKILGYGGTDFNPVFKWIETNLKKKDKHTDCLIYFSDGDGDFPAVAPDYPVFMVLPEVDFRSEFIPDWVEVMHI